MALKLLKIILTNISILSSVHSNYPEKFQILGMKNALNTLYLKCIEGIPNILTRTIL